MARIHLLALLIAALVVLVSASSAPTFCKCTCFKSSTILPLGPQHQSSDPRERSFIRRSSSPNHPVGSHPPIISDDTPRSASTSCSECTKAFCLNQGIDFCKNAEEDDVVTMCFQRDSNKDKIIVWGFIFGTVGLLGWAAFKRVVEWREARTIGRQDVNYAPVAGGR